MTEYMAFIMAGIGFEIGERWAKNEDLPIIREEKLGAEQGRQILSLAYEYSYNYIAEKKENGERINHDKMIKDFLDIKTKELKQELKRDKIKEDYQKFVLYYSNRHNPMPSMKGIIKYGWEMAVKYYDIEEKENNFEEILDL